jgi:NADH:ubiquinone oxidoreductase subunit D
MTGDELMNTSRPASLSESLGFRETVVEVGMIHPGVRRVLSGMGGTISFIASLDDDRMTDLELEIGLGHRGFEKQVESRSWQRALPYLSRLGYGGGVLFELAYCGAVEALAGIEVPERAVWLRTLAAEFARISDHFARLAAVAAAVELPAAESVAQQGAALTAQIQARALGRGPLAGWVRLGGVASAPASDFERSWSDARVAIEAELSGFEVVGLHNPSLDRRLSGVGVLSAADCLAWSVTGPALRAAGNPMDLRRDAPYLAYGLVDFDVPIGEHGDASDRLRVVVEEIRQSLRILEQCQIRLAELDSGAIQNPSVDEEAEPGEGAVSFGLESSTGELSFFIVSDGSGLPRRIRCRAPSFFHAQALPTMLAGAPLDDLLPTVASMYILSPECDR